MQANTYVSNYITIYLIRHGRSQKCPTDHIVNHESRTVYSFHIYIIAEFSGNVNQKPQHTIYSFLITLSPLPGIVNQESRFIRSIHCYHVSFLTGQPWFRDDMRLLMCRRVFVVQLRRLLNLYSLLVTRRSPVIFFRESESLFEAFAPHMIAHDSCVFLSGLHRKYDREERALIVGGYADPPGVDPQKISACEKPHHHNTRPMENYYSHARSRYYTTSTSKIM